MYLYVCVKKKNNWSIYHYQILSFSNIDISISLNHPDAMDIIQSYKSLTSVLWVISLHWLLSENSKQAATAESILCIKLADISTLVLL